MSKRAGTDNEARTDHPEFGDFSQKRKTGVLPHPSPATRQCLLIHESAGMRDESRRIGKSVMV